MNGQAEKLNGLGARLATLYDDAQHCAELAGLVYIGDEQLNAPAIARRRRGSGFSFRDASGQPVKDEVLRQRIAAIAVPPAWRNVWICPDDNGHILAVGEDDRGRRQYIYHERWRELRDLLNSYRLISFAEHLPQIREHVGAQLRRRTLDRDRVLAAMVRIMDVSAIRIGNEIYAEENDSFGLSTLTRRHVEVNRDAIALNFPAKSGKQADVVLHDPAVARVVSALLGQRSRRLFTIGGKAIESGEVNSALLAWTGAHITAKDFRTWNGTVSAFTYLEQHVDSVDRERMVLDAIDGAAQHLGNTRAVARAHYVHPHVLSSFADGTFERYLDAAAPVRSRLLSPSERRLVGFLLVAWKRHGLGLPTPSKVRRQAA